MIGEIIELLFCIPDLFYKPNTRKFGFVQIDHLKDENISVFEFNNIIGSYSEIIFPSGELSRTSKNLVEWRFNQQPKFDTEDIFTNKIIKGQAESKYSSIKIKTYETITIRIINNSKNEYSIFEYGYRMKRNKRKYRILVQKINLYK